MKSEELVFLGVVIVVLGMIIIIAGLFKESAFKSKTESEGGIRGGGVVMIGPLPIIFGTDQESTTTVILLAIIMVVVSYILFKEWLR
jgi:uncharacterized protein (TIGR00304 family)